MESKFAIWIIVIILAIAILSDSTEESKEICIDGLLYRINPDKSIDKIIDGMFLQATCSD